MTTWKILVADELSEEGLEILAQCGELTIHQGMSEDLLRSTLPSHHALIVRSATKVTARALELVDCLAVIGRAGIGIDNIDVPAATERGIVVMNTPEAGAVTTAEHAVALLLSMARNIAGADASIRRGEWQKAQFTGVEIRGKVLGVLGLGRIGTVVAERGVGLQMEVLAYDPAVSQASAPDNVRIVELEELLQTADFLTVHVPLVPATQHLLNADRFALMKPGAMLVHAARGGIVDETALCDALDSGHLAGAALDVFEQEPLAEDSRLRTAKNLVLTPHLGASTKEAKRNVSLDMAHQVQTCLAKGVVLNGINVPRIAPSEVALVGPYLELTNNLASFVTQAFPGRLQSLRLTLQGAVPESSSRSLTLAMLAGALAHQMKQPVTPVNAERVAEQAEVRVFTESSSMKRDFMNLVRVEALIDDVRHNASGTVLGHRHGRLVEIDGILMDAIPEGPALVTFHVDRPGMLGEIGTVLGQHDVNISRMQLGEGKEHAIAIFNLAKPVTDDAFEQVTELSGIHVARSVR
ncbi:MAG: phosphoglycerate dehydrogenase [Planctomycetota bacterium]|nr:phosphoglycerate dehydrogenase [Planctomycetota bacterium]